MAESGEAAPAEGNNSFLEDELEALQSIYINETDVQKDKETTIVSIDLHPATADNLQEQYVKLTLKLTLKDGYPDVIPEINIRNPRGLSDEQLSSISTDLLSLAEDKKGNSMLFEIIEAAKEHLTIGNRPSEECAICLYGFHDDDVFTKTKCYHYFHSHCLARFAKNSLKGNEDSESHEASSEKELLCPVCRLPIDFAEVEESYPPPMQADNEFSMTDTILETQKKMQDLFIKQVEKGGIIDLEAEKNKYLIEISNVPSILDAASETKSEDESGLKLCEEKAPSPPTGEHAKNDKAYSQNHSSNRTPHPRSNQKFGKYDRRENNQYRDNRNNDGNRNYQRGGRNDYGRQYNNYNYGRGTGYDNRNKSRYGNTRKGNFHDSELKSYRHERHDSYDDRDDQSFDENSASPESKQYVKEESGSWAKEDVQEGEPECGDGADGRNNRVGDGKRSDRYGNISPIKYGTDRRNVGYNSNRRNYQYDDRRDNRYDRRNVKYDNGGRYERHGDSTNGRYDRRHERYDSRKSNEHYSSRNQSYGPGRGNGTSEKNRNKYSNYESEKPESKISWANEMEAKNDESTIEEGGKKSQHEVAEEGFAKEKSPGDGPIRNSGSSPKGDLTEEVEGNSEGLQENKSSNHHPDGRHNFSNRNSGMRKQNDDRNYSRHYQRSNSNGDRYNNAYPKQSNYQPQRRQNRPQHFRQNFDDLEEGESGATAKGAEEPNAAKETSQLVCDDEGSGEFSEKQHSRKNSARNDSGSSNYYRNYRDGKSGYGNRYNNGNRNYNESRPYRNNPHTRYSQNDYSDRTSDSSKRYPPKKFNNSDSYSSQPTQNDTDVNQETKPKETVVESDAVEKSSNKPTQVQPKAAEIESSVPTSNFLPPMSSVAPPPGFQNTRKIVYGLAAANPPPGFNRS